MATQVQYRRGTQAQNDIFVGALGEITIDTTNGTIRVHDGITTGGSNIATVAYVDNEIVSFVQDRISNGNSSITFAAQDGNVLANVDGNTVLNVASDGLYITGNVLPTANITYNLGSDTERWNDIFLANSTIYLGNAQISANATSLILTNPEGAQTVLSGTEANISAAAVTATGNIEGGNIVTAGEVVATGNVSGNFFLGNGSQLSGIDTTLISNGNSNVSIPEAGGNATISVAGQANVVSVSHNGFGALLLSGFYQNPVALPSGNVPLGVNSMLIGPVELANAGVFGVPDGARLLIL